MLFLHLVKHLRISIYRTPWVSIVFHLRTPLNNITKKNRRVPKFLKGHWSAEQATKQTVTYRYVLAECHKRLLDNVLSWTLHHHTTQAWCRLRSAAQTASKPSGTGLISSPRLYVCASLHCHSARFKTEHELQKINRVRRNLSQRVTICLLKGSQLYSIILMRLSGDVKAVSWHPEQRVQFHHLNLNWGWI